MGRGPGAARVASPPCARGRASSRPLSPSQGRKGGSRIKVWGGGGPHHGPPGLDTTLWCLGSGQHEGWGPPQASSPTSSRSRGTDSPGTESSPILDVAAARLGCPGQLLPPRPQETQVPEVGRGLSLPPREGRGAHLGPAPPSRRPGHTCALYSHYSFS